VCPNAGETATLLRALDMDECLPPGLASGLGGTANGAKYVVQAKQIKRIALFSESVSQVGTKVLGITDAHHLAWQAKAAAAAAAAEAAAPRQRCAADPGRHGRPLTPGLLCATSAYLQSCRLFAVHARRQQVWPILDLLAAWHAPTT
jgi:hypothetical protein